MTSRTPRRVAVVGSGVAGLTAAYVASRTARVTLYEADTRLGGHADTHRVTDAASERELAIDTGFIVHNRRTYPVLLRLFHELGVPTQESEMSLSVSDEETGLEWAGALGPRGLLGSSAARRDPAYWRMLTEIPRFHRAARRLLRAGTDDLTTLGDLLDQHGFTPYFRRHFMEPLVAAVWSTDPAVALDYPAAYLFTFLEHHGMLAVFGSPTWRTVTGGSHTYVDRVAATVSAAGGEIRTGAPVLGVTETADGVRVRTAGGAETYDAAVVASHPDQALALLTDPTPVQQKILAELPYSPNTALLHTDTRLLPTTRDARAAWNFRRPRAHQDAVLVTYDLTRLQRLPTDTRYLVTLGGEHLVDPATVIARRDYAHPLYTPSSVAARSRLPEIDSDRLVFAGAYHGWGFHEDGARSGLSAVERLGLAWPSGVSIPPLVPRGLLDERTPREPLDERTPRSSNKRSSGVSIRPLVPRGLLDERPTRGSLDERTPRERGGRSSSSPGRGTSPGRIETSGATAYATTITHTRREPFGRRFEHRSHTWLVDLDHLPERATPAGGTFEARDHFTGDASTIRAGLERFLAAQGSALRPGRVLMLAHPRAFGQCFNPISVHWCWADADGTGTPDATVVEVHNTYGDRHAYLLAPDADGRATTAKAMYVSPFHGTDGTYAVHAPPPDPATGRVRVSVSLRTDDGARFDAALTGAPTRAPRAPLASLRGAALIRMHGIRLWLRGLPVRPRPHHHQEGAR